MEARARRPPTLSVPEVWQVLEPLGPADGRHDYGMWR
jgi:hypothetical protein